jgi:hypothetical protein
MKLCFCHPRLLHFLPCVWTRPLGSREARTYLSKVQGLFLPSSTFHVFFHVYQLDRWVPVKQGPNCQKCKVLFLPSSTFDAFFHANELDQWVAVKQGPKVHSLSPIVHGMRLLHITWGDVVRSPMQNMFMNYLPLTCWMSGWPREHPLT